MWKHWVARSNQPHEPFRDFSDCRAAWALLSKLFPEMLAGVLMPNHLHLVVSESEGRPPVRKRIEGFLSAMSRRTKRTRLWQPISEGQIIPDQKHLRRVVRYVALNPCRSKLCRDPLEWYWSTYREVLGAAVDSEQDPKRLARALGVQASEFLVWLHPYVSGDPAVRVEGTPLPASATMADLSEYSLGTILSASAAALRLPVTAIQGRGPLRSMFIHLAVRHGWYRPKRLAGVCGLSERAVYHIAHQPEPSQIGVAELCLGDERLRKLSTLSEVSLQNTPRSLRRSGNK